MNWKAMLDPVSRYNSLSSAYLLNRKALQQAEGHVWMTDVLYRMTLTTGEPDNNIATHKIIKVWVVRKRTKVHSGRCMFAWRSRSWQ